MLSPPHRSHRTVKRAVTPTPTAGPLDSNPDFSADATRRLRDSDEAAREEERRQQEEETLALIAKMQVLNPNPITVHCEPQPHYRRRRRLWEERREKSGGRGRGMMRQRRRNSR